MTTATVTATIPQDPIIEKHILGIILAQGAEALVQLGDTITAEDFFTPAHATIFGGLLSMLREGKPIELAAVAAEFRRVGIMSGIGRDNTDAGGAEYLAELVESYSFDTVGLGYYLDRLHHLTMQRGLIRMAQKLHHDATLPDADAGELVEHYLEELSGISSGNHGRVEIVSAGEAARQAIDRADAIARGEQSPGLMTGFLGIDNATGGLQPGDLWTLGAATTIGKTALAHTIAVRVASEGGAALIASAEMGRESVANRMLQNIAGIPGGRLRNGNLAEGEWEARESAAAKLESWRLSIFDRAATVPEIAIRAKLLAARWQTKLSLIVVDYLQLMRPTHGDNRAQQVGGIAWDLKRLAMELSCPILLLSQLGRAGVRPGISEDERPPTLYDLKESGDVENHSNVVLLLHRPRAATMDATGSIPIFCKVGKARDGYTTPWPSSDGTVQGSITLRFRPELTRFSEGENL